MSTEIQQFLSASDNATDYADSLVAGLEQDALEDIDALFTGAGNRDEELWTEFEVNSALNVEDYDLIDVDNRDLDWSLGLAGLSAASLAQFFLDNREETIIKPIAYRMQAMEEYRLNKRLLKQAGKRGVEVVAQKGFIKISLKIMGELADLRAMPNKQLYQALLDVRAIRPPDKIIADSMGYVARMTDYATDSPQFKEEVANLISSNSKRGLQGMNRRAVENLYTARESGGNLKTLMAWIIEAGKNCSYCAGRGGEIDTYGNWLDRGMPGAAVCAGGDRCRCHLAAAS